MPTEKPTFEELVQEHAPFVRRTLAQMGVNARDLADVEQEVFRGADRGLPAFDPSLSGNPDTALRGWLFGICERQAASHRRAEIKRGEVLFATEELDSAAGASPSVEDRLIEHERKVLLDKLLDCLEPHRRAVVVAYELEGVAMADVAAALSIPVNTAWNRLRLGREDLRAAWKRIARKDGRGGVVASLGALFAGAAWCSEANAAAGAQAGSLSSGPTGSLPSGPTGSLAAAEGAASSAASFGGAATSVVIAPAQASFFGVLALGVPLALAGALVLGAGEEPPALPETSQRPAAVVLASGPAVAPAPVLVAPARTPSGGAPVLAAGGATLSVSGVAADHDVEPASGSGAGQPVPTAAPRGQGSAVPAAQRPAAGPARPVSTVRGELRYIEAAAQAMDRGDLRAAKEALDAHRWRYPTGNLAAERELLTARLHARQGRHDEAGKTASAFVDKNPDTPFRDQFEQWIKKP